MGLRLKLLIELEPAHRVFFRNLGDILLFRSTPPITTTSSPASFWGDVFVYSSVPWSRFLESMLCHMIAVVVVLILSQEWKHQVQPQQRRAFDKSDVIYYTPSQTFPALGSNQSRVGLRPKRQPDSAREPSIRVASEHAPRMISAPNIKLTGPPRPKIVFSNPALPAMPLSATGRSRLTVPAGPTSVVAPPPDLRQAMARRAGLFQASVVAPSPNVATTSLGRATTGAIAVPHQTVIAPPPTIQASIHKVGDINIGQSQVVAPSPRLPIDEQRALWGTARGTLGSRSATSVVPPPPTVQPTGTLADGRAGSLSTAGFEVVPPPPSVQGAGNSSAGRRVSSLSGTGFEAIPPAPSVQEAGNSWGGGRASSVSGPGFEAIPPAPSVQEAGNSSEGRRASSLSGTDFEGGALAPSAHDDGNSAPGGQLMAKNIHPTIAPPPRPVIDKPREPATEELPVRVIGLALVLPNSSYFSNYEVFIAEKRLGKDESELIKLVYVSFPYQRRLSEYGVDNSKVYKLRVRRDPTCDETLLDITWPQIDPAHPDSRNFVGPPALSPNDRNSTLPCYRTTADDYRRALSRH